MTQLVNLLEHVPSAVDQEQFDTLVKSAHIRLERIVSNGQCSPEGFWYDQEQNEWVLVLQGSAALEFEGESKVLEMHPGDSINIPAHRKHRVVWTSDDGPTVWLAVHY